jgi:hypothetical protein
VRAEVKGFGGSARDEVVELVEYKLEQWQPDAPPMAWRRA